VNYYPFHLGDYASHTGHLDPMEDLAYRRMLDAYYLREAPLPIDVAEIARLIRLRDHAAVVRDVLNEFFTQSPEGWRHIRCDEEIEKMQDKQAKARASAAASVNARKAKAQHPHSDSLTDVQRTFNERSTDVQLPTPTPTPTPTPVIKNTATVVATPDGVSESVWQDFVKHRKAKKAQVTQTVIEGIRKEAHKAGWTLDAALTEIVIRNWQSFKAEWVADTNLSKTGQTNQAVISGLTRGLIGGAGNVKLLRN
jgi:uncharacterized protein YdaU (DUF1376 family)